MFTPAPRLLRGSLTAAVIMFAGMIGSADAVCRCSGCGCKGGPGYRSPAGNCVSARQLTKICGNPPTSRCRHENAQPVCSSTKGQRRPPATSSLDAPNPDHPKRPNPF